MHERAERWLRTLGGLVDRSLQVAFARAELFEGQLGTVTEALNDVCLAAEGADPSAHTALGAFVPVLIDTKHLARVWSLRATAKASHLSALSRLLRCSTPEGHLLDRERIAPQTDVMQGADGRPLSLGERRAFARRPTRATLDQLMRDPHPMVVSIVLKNPRITEADVMRMAAFRPAVPNIVVEIATAWSHHRRVRISIVLNPGSPPAVSVPLLSQLAKHELSEVSNATDLAAVVRAAAKDLWDLRPPMPHTEPPEEKH